MGGTWTREAVLRYGENPHQSAALYANNDGRTGLAQATQLHGKEMSYNNYTDADAAWRAAWDHSAAAVAIVKHANPCGIAVGADIAEAHRKAHACDPVSAFGGVIAANREVTVAMAEQVAEIFTEVIVAPAYADGAVEVLQRKKNVRILVAGSRGAAASSCGRSAAARCCSSPTSSTPRATTRPTGPWPRARRRRGDAGRPRIRLARMPSREVERDPTGARRRLGGCGHGTGEPGGRGASGRAARR